MCMPHNPIFILRPYMYIVPSKCMFLLNTVIKQLPSFETELVNSITDTKYFTIEASYLAFTGGEINAWFQLLAHA